jgi:succinate dehydrogenase (ubiquinone) membrane anchor subunit
MRPAALRKTWPTRRAAVRSLASLGALQTSTKLTAPAAILKGTVNDPTCFPPPSRTHGSHHWAFERLLSASLVPLTVAAFATSGSNYPVLDGILGVSLVMHSHLGVRSRSRLSSCPGRWRAFQFDSIVVDYLHPRKFPVLGQVAKWGLRTATVATLVGIYQFNTNDIGTYWGPLYICALLADDSSIIGLTELIARAWTA